jgi:hypothetical protein
MRGGKEHRASPAGGRLSTGEASQTAEDVEINLRKLEALDASNLHTRWRALFGHSAPARLGGDLLRRAVAHRVQELALGGLSRPAQLRLRAMSSRSGKENTTPRRGASPAIVKPGTRFVREWQGEVHDVQVIDTGYFLYRGKTYRSLSTLARAITGTHQSGPRFFGLSRDKPRRARKEVTHG